MNPLMHADQRRSMPRTSMYSSLVDISVHRRLSTVPNCCLLILVAALGTTACTHDAAPPDQPATQAAAPKPSLWKSIDPASPVAVVSPVNESKLRAAMEQARSTAEQARQKWLYTAADDRPRWAVKWAAPLAGHAAATMSSAERTEHVWVSPVHWSPFRIEGVLASTPVNDLACGKHLGELVSFPIEEL